MFLCLALAVILVYAFKYLDDYFLVSDYQSEEFGFVGNEILRILFALCSCRCCSRSRLSISQRRRCSARSFSCMASILSSCVVVCRHEIFGADVLRVAEVLTEFVEHTQIVAPHGEVVYPILVTLGNQI